MELFRAIRRDGERKYLNEALDEILHCFEYYGIDALCLSFNGGKDCTVLLHLIRAALAGAGYTRRAMLPVVYFRVSTCCMDCISGRIARLSTLCRSSSRVRASTRRTFGLSR